MNHGTALLPAFGQADPVQLALAGFLARYGEPTRTGYIYDLRCFFQWCENAGLPVFEAKRAHLEVFARTLEERYARSTVRKRLSTVAGFYKFSTIDGFLLVDPAAHLRRPKSMSESSTLGLDRIELGALIMEAARASARDHALICLLGLNGLRVSEACGLNVEDLDTFMGHRVAKVVGKGGKPAVIPLAPKVARAVDAAVGEREAGPVLLGVNGARMTRCAAGRAVKRLAKRAQIDKRISPHSLRHSAITNVLDAGVPLRDAQIFARHADPRTTSWYDRNKANLDRHATYILTAYVAGGA